MNLASDVTLTQRYLTAQTRVNERQARVQLAVAGAAGALAVGALRLVHLLWSFWV
jgi:hypothetical protein